MSYHMSFHTVLSASAGSIALIGHHNVGKSVLFHRLTGRYVTVANYAGTTLEVARGAAHFLPGATVVDTPGIVTLSPGSADERATARMLFREPLRALVQVGDAKNLRRTFLLTVQLAETGVPLVLALNMMDEARDRGLSVDRRRLEEHLGMTVVQTVATKGRGLDDLAAAVQSASTPRFRLTYPARIEALLTEVCPSLSRAPISPRALALLWLSGDPQARAWFEERLDDSILKALNARRDVLQRLFSEPLSTVIQRTRLDYVEQLVQSVLHESGGRSHPLADRLGRWAAHPVWGLPILAAVLYGLYWFVGEFGAGTLVELVEGDLFGEIVNPWLTGWVKRLLAVPVLADFLVGEYGLWTMGMTYALALILPIVTTFFLAFGILEDSGYFSRLAVLSNRLFGTIGLNGKAALPMVLGLGCVTMATLTTRILETRRDRLLLTLLLALGVPCSAQLGLVMAMLGAISLTAVMIWAGVVVAVLLTVGWLAARLMPGERSPLLIELSPLRVPLFANVISKTLARLEWYLKEVIPLFLLGTAIMFVLDKTGVLPALIRAGEPLVVGWLGLPPESTAAFVMGFLRRDFGATGLFAIGSQGLLTPLQATVGMVTLTLFIPCVASVFMIVKEQGLRRASAMVVLIFPLAFLVGGLLHRTLFALGWGT